MCKKCGCNTCETDGTALMLNESKAPRSILSEGLKHHIDANKPLTDNFYTAGSRDYFDLIAEARSLYSRGILEFTNKRDIELLTETDQGHFGIFEGKKVPLDFPIAINEAELQYPDFNLNKNIKYQDTSISSGMWRYTGTEQGGKGVYRNLNNDQILGFDRSDFDVFRKNLSSHFDFIEESLNEQDELDKEKINILNQILQSLENQRQGDEDRENDIEDLDISIDQLTGALTGKDAVAIGFDQNVLGRFASLGSEDKKKVKEAVESLLNEVTRYSGFDRNPEDPDSIPFEPTGSVSEFREDLRALFGKFKGDLRNPEFIKGVAQIMVNWKSLLRSQIELDEAKFKGKTVDLNKPTRGDSKKFKVYVNSGKKNADGSIKVKKVNFGHGGSSAKKAGQKTMKIRKSNPKARKAFRARHNCDNPGPKTMARYWSCKKW